MSFNHKILVTGGNGFVGRVLCAEAIIRGLALQVTTRTSCDLPGIGASMGVGSIDSDTDWHEALSDSKIVIHLAAQTNIAHSSSDDALFEFLKVNVGGTLNLARQAAQAGVRRFVYISSIKVNGESTALGQPFTVDDEPSPEDAYGLSKAEAENGLRQLSRELGMEVTIIRPPLVYGPAAKGNFSSLLSWVGSGLPLPLGGVTENRRSLVALDNLVDFILTCIEHPKAANQTFLVSDDEDLSTAELLRRVAKSVNRPTRLFRLPGKFLFFAASLLRRGALAQRLLGSLQVDASKNYLLLGWRPPVSVDEGLRRAVEWRM